MAIRKVTQTTPPKKTTSPNRVDRFTNPNVLLTRDELQKITKEQRSQRANNSISRTTLDAKGRMVKNPRRK